MSPEVQTIVVRQATVDDTAEWLRMRRLLWPDDESDASRREMQHIIATEGSPVFVAVRLDGSLGGFLEAGTRAYVDGCDTGPVGYIEGWFVEPDLRGHGVGRALVAAAEDWARSRGLREMGSDTQLTNEGSRRAHLALGYHDHEHLVHFTKKI